MGGGSAAASGGQQTVRRSVAMCQGSRQGDRGALPQLLPDGTAPAGRWPALTPHWVVVQHRITRLGTARAPADVPTAFGLCSPRAGLARSSARVAIEIELLAVTDR